MGNIVQSRPYWKLSEIYREFEKNPSKNNSIEEKTENIDIEIHGNDGLVLHIDIIYWGLVYIQSFRIHKFQTVVYDLSLCGKLYFLFMLFRKLP